MKNVRVIIAALVAVGVTFGLFLFMYKLISMGSDQQTELDAISGIHFGPVEIPDEIMEKSRRKPKKPPPPKDPPPPPRMKVSKMDQTVQQMPQLDLPHLDVPRVG
jgi:protein TonB